MNSPLAVFKEFRQWRNARRENPIDLGPGTTSRFFGTGVGSNQPASDVLLRENVGVPGMATRAIANRVASLDPLVKISTRTSEGTLEDETLDDHLLKQLLDRPHPNYDRFQLFWLAASHIVSVGEAYWLKVRNRLRVPTMLQPLPPGNVTPQITNGIITGYVVTDGKANSIALKSTDVVRMWFPDPETMFSAEGYLGPNAAVADAQKFADQHLRSHYQSDATPKVMLKGSEKAQDPDPEQTGKYQNAWVQKFSKRLGTNPSAPMFLPPGWEPIIAAMASGADITPLLDHWQSNMLMNFGVPPSVLGRVVSGDRSSAETNQYVMDLHTVLPIATMMSGALTLQLAPDFDPNIWVEFDEFVSADKVHVLAREKQDIEKKIKSPQQILAARGEDPEAAPWGKFPPGSLSDVPYTGEEIADDFEGDDPDALFEPEEDAGGDEPRGSTANKELISRLRATSKAAPRRGKLRAHFSPEAEWKRVVAREKKFRPLFARRMRGIFQEQRKEAIKQLNAMDLPDRARADVSVDDIFDPTAWDKLFEVKVQPVRTAAYLDSAAEALAGIGLDQTFEFTPTLVKRLDKFGAVMVKQTGATTVRKLQKALAKGAEEGQGISSLTKAVNEAFGVRRRNAATIARTELLRATQDAQIESFEQSGVVEKKAWNDNRDNDVRDSHYGSLIPQVAVGESFTLGNGNQAAYPGDAALPPADSINCRCFVTPEFEEEA